MGTNRETVVAKMNCPICDCDITPFCDHFYDPYIVMYDWDDGVGRTRVMATMAHIKGEFDLMLEMDGLIDYERIKKLLLLA